MVRWSEGGGKKVQEVHETPTYRPMVLIRQRNEWSIGAGPPALGDFYNFSMKIT